MKFLIKNNTVTISDKNKIPEIQRHEWENSYLYSVIQREIIRRSAKRPAGDNCPMLYAMKNSDGLITSKETISNLYNDYVPRSITNYFGDKCYFDLIIPMPSSCSIPSDIAKIIQDLYHIDIFDVTGQIVKKEPSEMIEFISSNRNIPDRCKQSIVTALNRNKDKLNIKNVKVQDRHYLFPILKILGKAEIFAHYSPVNILLIDDIFTSGLTLSSMKKILSDVYPNAQISALTLFSPLPETLNKC